MFQPYWSSVYLPTGKSCTIAIFIDKSSTNVIKMEVSQSRDTPSHHPLIRIFPYKQSRYWGSPMTIETPKWPFFPGLSLPHLLPGILALGGAECSAVAHHARCRSAAGGGQGGLWEFGVGCVGKAWNVLGCLLQWHLISCVYLYLSLCIYTYISTWSIRCRLHSMKLQTLGDSRTLAYELDPSDLYDATNTWEKGIYEVRTQTKSAGSSCGTDLTLGTWSPSRAVNVKTI